ncbi:transducin-like enhancer protein 4 [Trichonephila inaurata madagascariensis]|uniref:Transducin-like enhancer protein 4 n=1 Tax=Trichonephila inaurata madagascariensis TaxID=2747483 RepID=A0A8X6ML38_9ARAC|nr:transducin-like enhancer protein 4 [Trichonephila inaurata madagascariensis]
MYPNRHPGDGMPPYAAYGAPPFAAMISKEGPPPAAGQPFKFTVAETCDRIKEEFSYLQAQYHRDTVSLKLECEKLASEKTEMQRHYVMYYEMSYGLNVEMHKQSSHRAFVILRRMPVADVCAEAACASNVGSAVRRHPQRTPYRNEKTLEQGNPVTPFWVTLKQCYRLVEDYRKFIIEFS